jgi:hypothetical protein
MSHGRAARSLVSGREPAFKALALLLALVASAATVGLSGSEEKEPVESAPGHVRPIPPLPYDVPTDSVQVATSAQLRSLLRRSQPTNIVLADGVYDGSRPFLNPHGHRLYAATLGGAVLRAGLSLGGNTGRPGGSVRGIVFDVRDPEKTVEGAEIVVWGSATGAHVLDVTLRGNRVIRTGLVVRQPEGFRGARLVARGFTDYGVSVDANDPTLVALARPFRLTDVDVAGVARPVPRSSNGTAEACVWVGNPGVVLRVRVRRCAWTGLWTGTAATDGLFDRIDVDQTPTGVYVEHFTRHSTFQRLRVGHEVRIGVVTEWAGPAWGGRPASVDNVIQDSWFASSLAGVLLDAGTTRTTVRRSTFVNQRWAAIGDYRGIDNAYYGNDYGAVAPGGADVTHEHLNSFGN